MNSLLLEVVMTLGWQLALLTVAVTLVVSVVGRRCPHLAYALWLVVLAKCFVPPLWGWSSDWLGWTPPPAWVRVSTNALSRTVETNRVGSGSEHPAHGPSDVSGFDSTRPPTAVSPSALDFFQQPVAEHGFLAVWLFGMMFLFGRVVGRTGERNRLLERSSEPADERIQAGNRRAHRITGVSTAVPVYCTSFNFGPGVIGIRRPAIYIPRVLTQDLSPAEAECMLVHELIHVRRRDSLIAQLQLMAQIVWWFHPLVWWMNRQLAVQRERCCDEEVVAALGGQRRDYAHCLLKVLEAKLSVEPLWNYPGVRPAELNRHRLEEIMHRPNMIRARAPYWSGLVALALAIVALPSTLSESLAQNNRQDSDRTRSGSSDQTSTPRKTTPRVLKYGDNQADGRKSIAGAGEMIRFQMPDGVDAVRALRVHCARYGYPQPPKEDVEITFLNEEMTESLHTELVPYSLFKRTRENRWTTIPLDEPAELPSTFWVVLNFNAERTKGVYVSYDTDTKGEYSRVGFNDSDARPTDFDGDWMVQVLLPRP